MTEDLSIVIARQLRILLVVFSLIVVACSSGDATITDPAQVTDVVWAWEMLKVTTGFDNEAQRPIQETTTIPNPESYTLILREHSTFSGRADCNEISGTYTSMSGYAFTVGPSTMAACGDDSLDQQYLQLLGNVVAGGPDGAGGFALETAGGAERLEFRNGGSAPTP